MKNDDIENNKGFTLLEVLIALAICAIAAAAILTTINRQIVNSASIAQYSQAQWVAAYQLRLIQLDLLEAPNHPYKAQGNINMLNKDWQWQAYKRNVGHPEIQQVTVEVYSQGSSRSEKANQKILELSGYMP